MAKARKLEDTLAALERLRKEPISDAAIEELRRALDGKSSHAAARAAQIAAEFEVGRLAPDLAAAFDRFMTNPVKSDPGCRAKAAIADALYRIGSEGEAVFLRGIRHLQLEPVYGGKADTAGELRGVCALGLVRLNHPDVLTELADLLADPESPVRAAAARAIAYSENQGGAPLLRLKVLCGDEPHVISECMTGLLKVAPASSLFFVARLLDSADSQTSEAAALALGGSRLREAFEVLREWWERTAEPERRRTGLVAIAMLRHDRPIDFLLSLVASAAGPTARDAVAALAMYRHDDALRRRVSAAAEARDDVDLRAAIAEAF